MDIASFEQFYGNGGRRKFACRRCTCEMKEHDVMAIS
jgi:hypothetical protein